MRHETKGQSSEGEKEPQPPGVIPEMVIDQCGTDQNRDPNSKPESLAFDEKVHIAVGITCKSAGAEQHDDSDDEHGQHRQKKEICALALHYDLRPMVPTADWVARATPVRLGPRVLVSATRRNNLSLSNAAGKESVIARTRSPTRETRALPGTLRSTLILIRSLSLVSNLSPE